MATIDERIEKAQEQSRGAYEDLLASQLHTPGEVQAKIDAVNFRVSQAEQLVILKAQFGG